jgi:ABC-type dipeptide/oligopeptide/nickel transport system permease component
MQPMIAQELAYIFLSALVVAAIIATPLSMIPALQPKRKRFLNRFGYAFSNYGIPVWCVFEMVFWLMTHRWVPWVP